MKRYWDYPGAPTHIVKDNRTQIIKLHNGAAIQPLTASERSVRGPHPARLLLDEIDEMDENILESAKGQPMPQDNWLGVTIPQQTTMVSTLQYADGTMMKEMARFEEEGLPVMEWCTNTSPGWIWPFACMTARRAEHPVPQGERSQRPGDTMHVLRATSWPFSRRTGAVISVMVMPGMSGLPG